jgi:hypothetical protein
MASVDGSLARKLEFEVPERGAETRGTDAAGARRLRLAQVPRALAGPDKYRLLEHRRHQAQIKARRLLDLMND